MSISNTLLNTINEHVLSRRGFLADSFRGLAGVGLASLLLALGHKVSGSDKATTLETDRLQKLGLQFYPGHTEQEVADCDMVIYSSAIKPGNVAYEAAYKQGIPLGETCPDV